MSGDLALAIFALCVSVSSLAFTCNHRSFRSTNVSNYEVGDCVQFQKELDEEWDVNDYMIRRLGQKGKHSFRTDWWSETFRTWRVSTDKIDFDSLEYYRKVPCPVEIFNQ